MAGNFFDFQDDLAKTRKPRVRPAADAAAPSPAGDVPDALTVAQLTARIEQAIKSGVPGQVLVRGEVSNLKHYGASGHIYFTLKDAEACIDCVMFRSDAAKLRFSPQDGLELLAGGRVAVYPQRGRYQLYVTSLQPLGAGALELAFRQLCEKLKAEGLFDTERKKPLPAYPTRIALVTSRQTAALQDMLKVLRRFPWVRLMLYHVPVQGNGAAGQIAQALDDLAAHADRIGGIDVILLGRGGGSLEDLWQFNEEVVARAIVASPIPIITGIGHEVDVSIADMVADYHAHTPTEAAQVAMNQWRTADETVGVCSVRLLRAMRSGVGNASQRLAAIANHEFFRRPGDKINRARQHLDDLQVDLDRAIRDRMAESAGRVDQIQRRLLACGTLRLRRETQRLSALELRLRQRHPASLRALASQRVESLSQQLNRGLRTSLATRLLRLSALERHLTAVGPRQVLARGYSITMIKRGSVVVRSQKQIKGGERLVTHVAEGQIESIADDPNQPSLF